MFDLAPWVTPNVQKRQLKETHRIPVFASVHALWILITRQFSCRLLPHNLQPPLCSTLYCWHRTGLQLTLRNNKWAKRGFSKYKLYMFSIIFSLRWRNIVMFACWNSVYKSDSACYDFVSCMLTVISKKLTSCIFRIEVMSNNVETMSNCDLLLLYECLGYNKGEFVLETDRFSVVCDCWCEIFFFSICHIFLTCFCWMGEKYSTPQHTRTFNGRLVPAGPVRARALPHTEYVMSAPAQRSSGLRFRPVFSCSSLPLIDSSLLVYRASAKLNIVLSWRYESHRCFSVLHKQIFYLKWLFYFTFTFLWAAVALMSIFISLLE